MIKINTNGVGYDDLGNYMHIYDPFEEYPWGTKKVTPWYPNTITTDRAIENLSLAVKPDYVITDSKTGRTITMLVPGIKKEDIKITLNAKTLKVTSNIQEKHALIKDKKYEFTLQGNEEVVETSLADGVLTIKTKITVPEATEQTIPIGLKNKPELLNE